jgi:hypothetical protein
MKIYHTTSCITANQIKQFGFQPNNGSTWFASTQLCNDPMFSDEEKPLCVVEVDVGDEDLSSFEDSQFKCCHPQHDEWEIPNGTINQHKSSFTILNCP